METMLFRITKEHLSSGQLIWHLSGPIENIYTHNEMSFVFNLGLISPLHNIVYPCLSLIFKISLIFMNMQMN